MLLYLHIPYCDSKCHYCSFNSYVDRFDTRKSYMQAMQRQLSYELERFDAREGSIKTLFIGGGTPSTVAPEHYAPLFDLLHPYLALDAEISTEANPNSATLGWLEGMKSLGVNRISFGVQSFDSEKLKRLGRAHSPAQAIQAIERAAEAGFERISLDLIYNCAGDDRTLLDSDLERAFSLPIGHLSAYELSIEKGTLFQKHPEARQNDDELARWVVKSIEERGLDAYEISNFGDPCLHNLGYWRLENYIGLGAGAVGFFQERRFYPSHSIEEYIDDPLAHRVELLNSDALRMEKIFLGLRSRVGLSPETLLPKEEKRAKLLLEEGKLSFKNSRYYNRDFFLSDEIALFLMQ